MSKTEVREKGRFAYVHYFVHLRPIEPFPKKWETATSPVNTDDSPFPKKWDPVQPETVIPETYKTKIYKQQREVENKETSSTSQDGYFNDFEKQDLLMMRMQCNALVDLDDEEVVEVFELHCKENEKSKGWVKPQGIKGIKTLLMQNQFYLKPGFESKKQKQNRLNQEAVKKREFDEAQEAQAQKRMDDYLKSTKEHKESKPSQEKSGKPRRFADILKGN
jgi:hypothetical protein